MSNQFNQCRKIKSAVMAFLFALGLVQFAGQSAELGQIVREVDPSKLVPIVLTGFSGEVATTLRFDLEIGGFQIVEPGKGNQLVASGTFNGRLEGRLTGAPDAKRDFAKAYTGDNARLLAHSFANDIIEAVWNTKGVALTRIAFKVDTGPTSEIYISDYDGHNAVQLTHDSSIVAAPVWQPGKRVLFYTSYKQTFPFIYSHDIASGVRQAVAKHPGLNTSASVSPDGRRVAMILSKNGSPDVYVADIDGSNLKQLTATKEDESSPCWSPDGRNICFSSKISGRSALYLVPANGGGIRRLRTDGVANATEPDWSPDGKTIVFTSLGGDFTICTVPADGGSATSLVAGEDPYWAPNSRTVVFARRVAGKRKVSLLDVPTKRVKDIQQVTGSCSQPCWAR